MVALVAAVDGGRELFSLLGGLVAGLVPVAVWILNFRQRDDEDEEERLSRRAADFERDLARKDKELQDCENRCARCLDHVRRLEEREILLMRQLTTQGGSP